MRITNKDNFPEIRSEPDWLRTWLIRLVFVGLFGLLIGLFYVIPLLFYADGTLDAFKKDRLGGWPVTISLGGFFALLLRMIFGDIDGYIIVGEIDIYYWELGLFFLVGIISFMPVTILDAKRLVAGLPHLSSGAYWKKVTVYFIISLLLALLIRLLVYRFIL